ncbi:MAG: hypothetical protein ACE5HT_12495 [Gemmatimonadales bacterium]
MWKKLVIVMTATAAAAACNDSTGNQQFKSNVSVSFSTQSAAPAPAPSFAIATPSLAAFDDTLTSGIDTLIITQAQLVLRKIELKQATSVNCDLVPEPPECEDVELGPVLVDMPLTPGAQRKFSVALPMGTFTAIEFEIHKVSGDAEDQAFLQANPGFLDKSIRVTGTFNGQAFTFESDLDVEQTLVLIPALVVGQAAATNVTIRVDISTWFVDQSGALVDPATANKGGQNENVVKDNIKVSLKAFEDKDEDGDDSDEG